MSYRVKLYNYCIDEIFTSYKKAKEFVESLKGGKEKGEISKRNYLMSLLKTMT